MARKERAIRLARVDIPAGSVRIYMFVDRSHAEWDSWWAALLEFLLTFASDDLAWHLHPDGDAAVSKPHLTLSQRETIATFIRTAPKSQVDAHRTLRQAVGMTQAQEERLELVYFSGDVSGMQKTTGDNSDRG